MVEVELSNGDLIDFIERCACKGVVLVTPTEKVSKNFFNFFYLDAKKGEEDDEDFLEVKAVDSEEKRMFIRHYLRGVTVNREGSFAVSDANLLLDILKSIPSSRDISFKLNEEGNVLTIETTDSGTYYGYNIRQTVPPEDVEIALDASKSGVGEWEAMHSWEDGIPKFTLINEKDKPSALYNTIVNLYKSELRKVLKDSVSLTRDQDLKLGMHKKKEDWFLQFNTGKRSDNIITETQLEIEPTNAIEFSDVIITNLQPIISNLFDHSTFYMRLAGDGALKFWIASQMGNIELNFCSSST